ncbi:MAG: 4'-phosphopantetheinyl transferase superfamily protein [Acidobacteria bacterium]|nr:MAG: 4'-phosphopantetheinyl transferase superfamily protein [Acidobacteriota bacterium]
MQSGTQTFESAFEQLFSDRRLGSAFVSLEDLDVAPDGHPDLSQEEHRVLAGLRFEKRRRDWLGGRLAAKRAVVKLARLGPLDHVEILPAPTREPQVYSPPSRLRPDIQVSISHAGMLAGAVAGRINDGRIGFDMERVATVDPAVYSLAFTDSEIQAVEAATAVSRTYTVLALWTAKEAVTKALGTGLSICLKDIQLVLPAGIFEDGWTAEGFEAVFRRNGDECGSRLTIQSRRIGDYVLSLARLADAWKRPQGPQGPQGRPSDP